MRIESIWQAQVQQRVFRELVECLSRPGEVRDLARCCDGAVARRAVLATLLDGECSLADPHGMVPVGDWPLLQARRGAPTDARYVVAAGDRAPDFQPALGSLESPEFGATLLVEVACIGSGAMRMECAGPGIPGRRALHVEGLHAAWLESRAAWVGAFPLGVDLILADATRIAALPRSTQVDVAGELAAA